VRDQLETGSWRLATEMKTAAVNRKPNSVPPSRRPFGRQLRRTTIIPLAPPLLAGSSGLPGSFERAVLVALPYLALLRAGFCLPPVLPRARCALTAPFHHCPAGLATCRRLCVFCATFLQVTLTGRYPAHCPAEFGLSSLRLASSRLAQGRPVNRFQRTCPERAPKGRVEGRLSGSLRREHSIASHPPPAKSHTALTSCTGCCGACRSLPLSSRCSSCSLEACRPEMSARRTP